jgi:hypothetical protein
MNSDYTQIEDYDCTKCDWSLHVEQRVWSETDDHSLVVNHIQSVVRQHAKTHEPKMFDTSHIGDSPYFYVSPSVNNYVDK